MSLSFKNADSNTAHDQPLTLGDYDHVPKDAKYHFELWQDPQVDSVPAQQHAVQPRSAEEKENINDGHLYPTRQRHVGHESRNPLAEINVSTLPEYSDKKFRASQRNLFGTTHIDSLSLAASPSTPTVMPNVLHPTRGSRLLVFDKRKDERSEDSNSVYASPITPNTSVMSLTPRRLRPRPTRPPKMYGSSFEAFSKLAAV